MGPVLSFILLPPIAGAIWAMTKTPEELEEWLKKHEPTKEEPQEEMEAIAAEEATKSLALWWLIK